MADVYLHHAELYKYISTYTGTPALTPAKPAFHYDLNIYVRLPRHSCVVTAIHIPLEIAQVNITFYGGRQNTLVVWLEKEDPMDTILDDSKSLPVLHLNVPLTHKRIVPFKPFMYVPGGSKFLVNIMGDSESKEIFVEYYCMNCVIGMNFPPGEHRVGYDCDFVEKEKILNIDNKIADACAKEEELLDELDYGERRLCLPPPIQVD